MTTRVPVSPSMLEWAIERSGRDPEALGNRFPKLTEWLAGDRLPTVKQLQDFANATYTPVGFLYLPEPPEEALPVADFRTVGDRSARPSPDLLDTLYLCQQRQEWFKEYALRHGTERVSFVESVTLDSDPVEVAAAVQGVLGFAAEDRSRYSNWTEALRGLIDLVEATGVLVMVSGVVGSNTHRVLDPQEFRGLALADDVAPLIFVNGADTKAAQIFTIIHEFAHLWLGSSGVDRPDLAVVAGGQHVERWCNAVAAEVLVPISTLPTTLPDSDVTKSLQALARTYKVSTLVILRRLVDAGLVARDQFASMFETELTRVLEMGSRPSSGGDFYNTQPLRVSRRFARALITDTMEGATAHRDAYYLLGIRKAETFREFGESVGVAG